MKLDHLSRPARLFLIERLGRLHASLRDLGERLRAGIAQLVGGHFGDAVRDALAAALFRQPASPARRPDHDPWPWPHDDRPRHDQDPAWDDTRPEEYWEEPEPEPFPRRPPEPPPPRWHSLVGGGVRLASLWFRHRISVLRLLGFGAVAALVTLAAGPLTGTIVTTVGTALLLTTTADAAAAAAEVAAQLPAP